MDALPTGTVTFLFTDVAGSTRLWEENPAALGAALARHDACLRDAIGTCGGHVFKTIGDDFCAVFAQAADALRAALAAQLCLRAPQPTTVTSAGQLFLKVRMALHTGTPQVAPGDYIGPTVHRVARLVNMAHGEQILISGATQELVQDNLPDGVDLRHLGPHRLQDIQRPMQVYQVLHPDLPADFPPLRPTPALPAELTREELLDLLFEIHRRLEAQKQHFAFLSVDVVDSTPMKQAGTPLTAEYSFGQYQRWVNQIVQQCGGETYSPAGDGVMCRFHSDAQALRAARRLQEELDRFNAEQNRLPQPFRLRCGVSAGEIALDPGGEISQLRSAVLDRAAALQKRAGAGGILVSGEVAGTALIELGPLTPLDEPIAGALAFAWTAKSH